MANKNAKKRDKRKRENRLQRLLIFLLLALATFGILSLDLTPQQVHLTVNEIAGEDIYYTGATTAYASELATTEAKAAAADAVSAIYVVDEAVTANLLQQLTDYFAAIDELNIRYATDETYESAQYLEDARAVLPGEYSDEVLRSLRDLDSAQLFTLRDSFGDMLADIYNSGVAADGIDAARSQLAMLIGASTITGDSEVFLKTLLDGMTLPFNQAYDAMAHAAAIEEAMEAVLPVMVTVQSGQKLVSRGSEITEEQIEMLEAVGMQRNSPMYAPYIGLLLLIIGCYTLLYLYLRFYQPQIYKKRSLLWLLLVITVAILLLCKLLSLITISGEAALSLRIGYLLPVAAAAILLSVLLNRDTALFVNFLLAIFVGVIMSGELAYTLAALCGGAAAAITASQLSQRSQFVSASVYIALANLLAIGAYGLLFSENYMHIGVGMLFGAGNGLFSAILAMGLLPFLESAFGITTVIRLLELSNSNHPLLKRLMMEAPGTYNHSILVGNLAEAAADAIGADALKVRVASYYHDIGKLKRPYFYIENQRPGENPHDKLQPALSAMIITSHTTEGAKLLRDDKFPEEIIDIVEQHHGNSVLSYFYDKAKKQALAPEDVRADDYRYKGRIPQTKEAALVMLADGVQAAVQAVINDNKYGIEETVRELIRRRMDEGQLQECPLTFKDIDAIIQSFLMVLSGMNHSRIQYPEQMLKDKEESAQAAGAYDDKSLTAQAQLPESATDA
ncbi:MAG: HDIG domain-containing protein [Bacillota bacterium]|nr:HDIG domain-containing protein [Bacillota bacterium]